MPVTIRGKSDRKLKLVRDALLGKPARHELARRSLQKLPDAFQGDMSMVILLSPDEVQGSLGNLEFEHPTPSLL
jgi:hypothetical protein